MPLSVQPHHAGHPGLTSATELAAQARHAIAALFSAVNYSDHRQARLAVREGIESYARALRAEGTSREATTHRVAELLTVPIPSGADTRYLQALRAELARWSTTAYDGR